MASGQSDDPIGYASIHPDIDDGLAIPVRDTNLVTVSQIEPGKRLRIHARAGKLRISGLLQAHRPTHDCISKVNRHISKTLKLTSSKRRCA